MLSAEGDAGARGRGDVGKPSQRSKAVGGGSAGGWHPDEMRLHTASFKVFQGFSEPWCHQRGFDELKKKPLTLHFKKCLSPTAKEGREKEGGGGSVNTPYILQGKEGSRRHAEPQA